MSQRSHIEAAGKGARHYDLMMDLVLVGRYQAFIERAIKQMNIRKADAILDLGSGTGRNICVMLDALGPTGQVVGVDLSPEMLQQARKRCHAYPRVSFLKQRIEESLPFHEEFDKVFISFALHGFEDDDKERVIANAHSALRPGGTFWILDYNEFDLDRLWVPVRWAFQHFECELASEFLSLDLRGMLAQHGFSPWIRHLCDPPIPAGICAAAGGRKATGGLEVWPKTPR
jgi:demethylmenaquinone methyltransferase/2-methoxy-6-polyprenyl-1,4-benzoquinol methylase